MRRFSVPFKAMGTHCQILLVAESQAAAQSLSVSAIAAVADLEREYSRYLPSSLISRINAAAGQGSPIALSEEARSLFAYAHQVYVQSEGLFDVTSGVLRQIWDFKTGVVPSASRIESYLARIGWSKVAWSGEDSIALPAGFELDFGGFVKEYAADVALAALVAAGVEQALVDLGGDIAVSAGDWPIAIKNPVRPSEKLRSLQLSAGGFATSGNYERCFIHNGSRYSHILNPKTGWPVVTPASVSVVAESCLLAGSVTTVAMLSGEAGCIEWLDSVGLPYCCVFNDGAVVNTL